MRTNKDILLIGGLVGLHARYIVIDDWCEYQVFEESLPEQEAQYKEFYLAKNQSQRKRQSRLK